MKTNTAAKLSAAPVALIAKIDGRTRLGRAVKNVAAANDTTLAALETLSGAFVAPALPEVREVTQEAMVIQAPPSDGRMVLDVIAAGWRTTAKTLSYGLCRAGVAPARIASVIAAAMASGLIRCERGVWQVSALAV